MAQYDYRPIIIACLLLLAIGSVLYFLNTTFRNNINHKYDYIYCDNSIYGNSNFTIPSNKFIDNYCKEKGFEYGYVSSTICEKGIYCYTQIGEFTQHKCFNE